MKVNFEEAGLGKTVTSSDLLGSHADAVRAGFARRIKWLIAAILT